MDLLQCRGAQRKSKVVYWSLVTSNVEWLESEWKYGRADVLKKRLWANAEIQVGEVVLELEPGGGHLKYKTAKPAALNVDDL